MLGKRNVFLIGPMGSGKTAVGKYIARLTSASFYDSDAEIEHRTGVDVSTVPAINGARNVATRTFDPREDGTIAFLDLGDAGGKSAHGATAATPSP